MSNTCCTQLGFEIDIRGNIVKLIISQEAIREAYSIITENVILQDIVRYIKNSSISVIFLVGDLANSKYIKQTLEQSKNGTKVIVPNPPHIYPVKGGASLSF